VIRHPVAPRGWPLDVRRLAGGRTRRAYAAGKRGRAEWRLAVLSSAGGIASPGRATGRLLHHHEGSRLLVLTARG
jgi:hypothetical protein